MQRRRNRRRLRDATVLEALYHMGLHHGDPLHPHSVASLRAAIPGNGVQYTLAHLAGEGYVRAVDGERWALTDEGLEVLQKLLYRARMDGQAEKELAR
jgi:hypothetical protein